MALLASQMDIRVLRADIQGLVRQLDITWIRHGPKAPENTVHPYRWESPLEVQVPGSIGGFTARKGLLACVSGNPAL